MKRRDFLRHTAVSAAVLSFPSFHTSAFGQSAREQRGASKKALTEVAGNLVDQICASSNPLIHLAAPSRRHQASGVEFEALGPSDWSVNVLASQGVVRVAGPRGRGAR